ncbi:MAG: DUF4412 domain-containing protein [Bacteroidota bacterium]
MRTLTILTILLVYPTINLQSQFLKKLGDKAKKAAERTVERRVENETSEETDKALDKVIEGKPEEAASTTIFNFTDYMVMEIIDKKNSLITKYRVGATQGVFASEIEMKPGQKTISIIDVNQKKIFALSDFGDFKNRTTIPFSKGMSKSVVVSQDWTVKPNGETKEILGYTCEGFDVGNEQYSGTVWVTNELDSKFPNMFKNMGQQKKKNNAAQWMNLVDGMALEIKIVDNSKRKPKTTHMICREIGSEDLTIDTKDYKTTF